MAGEVREGAGSGRPTDPKGWVLELLDEVAEFVATVEPDDYHGVVSTCLAKPFPPDLVRAVGRLVGSTGSPDDPPPRPQAS